MLKQAMACNYEGDALVLAKAAKIHVVRKVHVSPASNFFTLMESMVRIVNKSQCYLLARLFCLCC